MSKKSRLFVVDQHGSKGTVRTIQEAALKAGPGDTILVKPGIYREHVALVRGGEKGRPLTVKAETPGTVFVRGSEVWNPRWTKAGKEADVYSAPLPWDLFTSESNPFRVKPCIWSHQKNEDSRPADRKMLFPYSTDYPAVDAAFRRIVPEGRTLPPPPPPPKDRFKEPWPAAHDRPVGDPAKLLPYSLGQLFYNGRELPQSQTESEVRRVPGSWILSVDGKRILIHFPIGGKPDDSKLEITVRDRVFAPARRGLEYIVVSGFVFEHCGNQGPFPQNGMVSIRSGSYWTIENNIIRFAKTIGLDCGSEYWKLDEIAYTVPEDRKHFSPRGVIIRHNLFCDNGLTAISSHENTEFQIVDNVMERNNALSLSNAYECEWEEEGAIKLHGANHTLIAGNLIRNNCGHGIWIDNGHTHSRITRNVVLGNQASGIYIEVGSPHTGGIIDHNIVSSSAHFFNFHGAGITINDTPDLIVAHNLVIENIGPGLCCAAAKGRTYGDKARTPVSSSRERIFNNLFIANHGNVEMPFPHEHARDNQSDSNVFVNAGDFKFWRSRAPFQEILRFAKGQLRSKADRAALKKAALTGGFSPEIWPKITGWETHSLFLDTTQMTCFVKPYETSVRLRIDPLAVLFKARCKRVPGVDKDFCGNPIRGNRILPGPFQNLRDGDNYYLLAPRNGRI